MKLRIGEPNLGAVVGAVAGSIGGLLALGIPPALMTHKPEYLIAWPSLSIVSWLISAIVGWLIGGQIGPRLESRFGERNASLVGGIAGGLLPATAIALWSWHLITQANPGTTTAAWRYDDVDFSVPASWSVEKAAGGVLIQSPEINDEWRANVLLEIKEYKQPLPLENALDDLALSLKASKEQFRELRRAVSKQAHGLPVGLIEYTCVQRQTPLTEWAVLFQLGGGKQLAASASSSTALWTNEYYPVFRAILNSVRPGETDPQSP